MVTDSQKASRRSSRPHTSRSIVSYRQRQAERQTKLDELVESVLAAGEQRDGDDSGVGDAIQKLETKLEARIAKLHEEHAEKVAQLRSATSSRRSELNDQWNNALLELAEFAPLSEVAFALDVSERKVRGWVRGAQQSGADSPSPTVVKAESPAAAAPTDNGVVETTPAAASA